MGLIEVDQSDGPARGYDGVALLDRLWTRQRKVEKHLVELALRAFESGHLSHGFEVSRHPGRFLPHRLAQSLKLGRVAHFPLHQVTSRLAQQRHHGRVFRTRDFREGGQHPFVLGKTLPTFRFGKLIGHGLKVETTLGNAPGNASLTTVRSAPEGHAPLVQPTSIPHPLTALLGFGDLVGNSLGGGNALPCLLDEGFGGLGVA